MARWFRQSLSVPGPFVCRCLNSSAMLRFHTPLIEPDVRISRIRLSDKGSGLWLVMSSEASELFPEFLGSHQSPGSCSFRHSLELRPLPSTGVTRLHRYYGPFRHPIRPGLSLAGFRLKASHLHRLGFPVLRSISLCMHALATTPAGWLGAIALLPQPHRPSLLFSQVGSRVTLFEACSAFTRITACMLAESPM